MIKKVGANYYAHVSNIEELGKALPLKDQGVLIDFLYNGIVSLLDYDVIKIDVTNRNISLIKCFEWNTLPEPWVKSTTVYSYCDFKKIRYIEYKTENCPIYHNKWMFVADNYTGFNIQESKNRAKLLETKIPNYKQHKSKIGYFSYWKRLLQDNNISLTEEGGDNV